MLINYFIVFRPVLQVDEIESNVFVCNITGWTKHMAMNLRVYKEHSFPGGG